MDRLTRILYRGITGDSGAARFLIDLGIVAGVSRWDIMALCLSDVLMIACGAFGALTVGNVKWVWWFFGMCWFLHIIFALGKSWAEAAKAKGGESGSVYSKIAGITVIAWFCYPIVWVFAEGFGNFSVTFEVCSCPRSRLSFFL